MKISKIVFINFYTKVGGRIIRTITSRGKWGWEGAGKKKRKKKRRATQGVAGFGEKPDQRNQPNSDAAVRENLENGGI